MRLAPEFRGGTGLTAGGARGIGCVFGGIARAGTATETGATDQGGIGACAADIEARRGGIPINNAAPFDPAGICRETCDRHFALDVAGALFTPQAEVRATIARGRDGLDAVAPGVRDGGHRDEADVRFARGEGLAPGDKTRAVAAAGPAGRMDKAVFPAGPDAGGVGARTCNIDGGNWMNR